jgi:hypothetical protein
MWQKMVKDTNLAKDAKKLARIFIWLQKRFPLFMKDVATEDPDSAMDIGFNTYDELERMANGSRLNKVQQ